MTTSQTAVICSYRLGMHDGVSVEASKWAMALTALGWLVRTVAGNGTADVLVPGLGLGDTESAPSRGALDEAFFGADVVVVENLCSLPLNALAASAVAGALRGRSAVLHHHDLALERPELAHLGPPPDDAAWRHVCTSETAATLLLRHGIKARVVRNAFDPSPPTGRRAATRALLGVGDDERLVLQPTRAIARKAVQLGLGLAERLGATYWLTGPAEDGFDEELAAIKKGATTRFLHEAAPGGNGPSAMADAYAACDLVVLPSTHEGFGNPAIEAASHRRPLALGSYPVADELRSLGFSWFALDDVAAIEAFLVAPERELLEHNHAIVAAELSLERLPETLSSLFTDFSDNRLVAR